jgi:hypothetical protein
MGVVPMSPPLFFRDRDEDFTAGHTFKDQTREALDASAALIVLASPACAEQPLR